MNTEFQYVSIREILSRVTRHSKLQGVDLESVIQYTLDFFGIAGVPPMFEDRQDCVEIHHYHGDLPCDTVQIIQVRDERTKIPLTAMTDSFNGHSRGVPAGSTFKTQNRTITTSFPEGRVRVSYKAIKTDADGFPMIPDEPAFLLALEYYIVVQVYTDLFDSDKLSDKVLAKAEQRYAWAVGRCTTKFKMPSYSEMQSITNMMTRLIPSTREFYAGYKGMGDAEHYNQHR